MNSITKHKVRKILSTNLILISMLSAVATVSLVSDDFLLSSYATSVSADNKEQTNGEKSSTEQNENSQKSDDKLDNQEKETSSSTPEDITQLDNTNPTKEEIKDKEISSQTITKRETLASLNNSSQITQSEDQKESSKEVEDIKQTTEINSKISQHNVPRPTSIKAVVPISKQTNSSQIHQESHTNTGSNSNNSLKMRHFKRTNIIRSSQIAKPSVLNDENKQRCSIVEHELIDFPIITSDENLINYNPETNPLPYHKEWSFSQPVSIDNELIFGTSTETKPQVDKRNTVIINDCDITICSRVKLDIDLKLNECEHKVPISLVMQSINEYKDLNKGDKVSIYNPHILNHKIDDTIQYSVDNTKISFIKYDIKNDRISKPEDIIRNFVLNKGEFIKQNYKGEVKCIVKPKKTEVRVDPTSFNFNFSSTIYATEDIKIDIIPIITNIKEDTKEYLDYFI